MVRGCIEALTALLSDADGTSPGFSAWKSQNACLTRAYNIAGGWAPELVRQNGVPKLLQALRVQSECAAVQYAGIVLLTQLVRGTHS